MSEGARERLAEVQSELLAALLAGGPSPAGFDERLLRVEARSLLAKRRGIVAMLTPEVVDELGDRFRPLFDEYAIANPRTSGSRAREDATCFAAWAGDNGHTSGDDGSAAKSRRFGLGRLRRPRPEKW
ncbi:MAG: hypothetical protein ABIQ18_18115 [Umezawaea sp.]